jgi:hypothetical protein
VNYTAAFLEDQDSLVVQKTVTGASAQCLATDGSHVLSGLQLFL